MGKKIIKAISLIMSSLLIFQSAYAVRAADNDGSRLFWAKQLLTALDISTGSEADETVSRGQFANIYARANNIYQEGYMSANAFLDTEGTEYEDSIELLHDMGIIDGVGKNNFAPEEKILLDDVVRLYVRALDMGVYSETKNGNHTSTAYSFGLFDDVKTEENYITFDNLVIMTYNFLRAPVVKMQISDSEKYVLDNDDNLLHLKFDILQINGTVIRNDLSGIWSADAAKEGYVDIKTDDGGILAKVGQSDIARMLGRTLDIYVYENSAEDEYTVICYEGTEKNKSLTIDICNIDFDNTSAEKIKYYKDGKDTVSSISLSSFPSYIVNGVYYDIEQFDIAELREYSGTLELLCADGASGYNVIIINAYVDYFVKNVEYYNGEMRIYDKGGRETLYLDDNEYSRMEIFYPNGAGALPYELRANMMLSVMKSFGSKRYIKILLSDNIVEGTISGYDSDDKTLTLDDGTQYDISPSYKCDRLITGKKNKLYIDVFGKVGWIEADNTDGYSFALLKRVFLDEELDEVRIKTVAESGRFTTFALAEKTKIDGLSVKDTLQQRTELEGVGKIANLRAGEYPIRYRVNDDGKITEIDTPRVRSDKEDKNSFRVTSSGSNVICSNDNILGKQTPLSDSTVVFLIPETTAANEIADPNFYTIGNKSLLDKSGSNTFTAFKVGNSSMYADLVILTKTVIGSGMGHDNRLFLVDKIREVYDDNLGEIRTSVTGFDAGTEKTYFAHEEFDKTKFKGIKRGDVLRFALYDGQIISMDKVFVYTNEEDYIGKYYLPTGGQKASSLAQIGTSYYYCGYVMKREGRLMEILPFDLAGGSQSSAISVPYAPDFSIDTRRVFIAPNKISIYDSSLGEVYAGDLEDIPAYEDSGHVANVIVRYRSRSAQEMIVLKDDE